MCHNIILKHYCSCIAQKTWEYHGRKFPVMQMQDSSGETSMIRMTLLSMLKFRILGQVGILLNSVHLLNILTTDVNL